MIRSLIGLGLVSYKGALPCGSLSVFFFSSNKARPRRPVPGPVQKDEEEEDEREGRIREELGRAGRGYPPLGNPPPFAPTRLLLLRRSLSAVV